LEPGVVIENRFSALIGDERCLQVFLPQLRIYCRYGMKAVEEGEKVDSSTWNPTAGDWTMYVPCDEEKIEWVKQSLSETSPRIKVFDVASTDRVDEDEPDSAVKSNGLVVDWNIKEAL